MSIALLEKRGIRFRRLKPSQYGNRLHELVRKSEPERAVDRLLVAGLIEARSCEGFGAAGFHLDDPELAEFYRSLFESESRHHSTYTRLAHHFAPEQVVEERLRQLYEAEAEIMAERELLPRMHS